MQTKSQIQLLNPKPETASTSNQIINPSLNPEPETRHPKAALMSKPSSSGTPRRLTSVAVKEPNLSYQNGICTR